MTHKLSVSGDFLEVPVQLYSHHRELFVIGVAADCACKIFRIATLGKYPSLSIWRRDLQLTNYSFSYLSLKQAAFLLFGPVPKPPTSG